MTKITRGNPLPALSEAEIKKAVADRLEIGQAQGYWLYLRLNSGELIAVAGETRRRIKLCPPGTADFVVFQSGVQNLPICQVTFLEIKSSKGKQSPEQGAFEKLAQMFNCRYYLVRDADEIEEILI